MKRVLALLCIGVTLAACESPTTQRYAISADNNQAIKALGTTGVGVRAFTPPATFDANCRALGPMKVADDLSHTQYIQKAFEDELKIAGAFAASGERVTLGVPSTGSSFLRPKVSQGATGKST